jgi:hypothetical protein
VVASDAVRLLLDRSRLAGGGRVAVYTSRDGRSWTRSGDRALRLGQPHQALLSGVAVFEHGVAAVGTVVGHSADGYDATVWFLPESR